MVEHPRRDLVRFLVRPLVVSLVIVLVIGFMIAKEEGHFHRAVETAERAMEREFDRYVAGLSDDAKHKARAEVISTDPALSAKVTVCSGHAFTCDQHDPLVEASDRRSEAHSRLCAVRETQCNELESAIRDRLLRNFRDTKFERHFAALPESEQKLMKEKAVGESPRLQALSHQCFAFKKLCEELEAETLEQLEREYWAPFRERWNAAAQ